MGRFDTALARLLSERGSQTPVGASRAGRALPPLAEERRQPRLEAL